MTELAQPAIPNIIRNIRDLCTRSLDELLSKGWISYLLIAALQLKVIWGIWRLRDITGGDTSYYFQSVYRWSQDFTTDPVWSPLYTSFYGTIQFLTGDVYASAILHRAIIVMLVALGVLAVLRKLLTPALALVIGAWWIVLPINFEALYEVHLFAFLPVLAALIVAGSDDTPWTRGSALAILVVATFLARMELVVAVLAYSLICFWREVRALRRARTTSGPTVRFPMAAYAVPAAIALAVCAFFIWRSSVPYGEILDRMHYRLALNMCQGYAFTWLQIHTDSGLNPWLDCRQLMQSVFGRPWLTLGEMIAANPGAVREYFWWNFSLLPNGLQVALYDAMSGTINPDYGPVRHVGSQVALVLGLANLIVLGWGCTRIVRRWDFWGPTWFSPRKGLWLLIFALLCVSFPVIFAIRPRPSYLYPTTLALMAMTGTALLVLIPARWQDHFSRLAVIGFLFLLASVPGYYISHPSDRPLYTEYKRLRPFTAELDNAGNRIILGDRSDEVWSYLGLTKPADGLFGYKILSSWKAPESLDQFLDRMRINVFLIQPGMMRDLRNRPEASQLLTDPQSLGWRSLTPPGDPSEEWLLLYRERR